jgi:FMN phosphatase YigB (HAD superfamily)
LQAFDFGLLHQVDIQAVLFDYGGTLVGFSYPELCLIKVHEELRLRLKELFGKDPPPAQYFYDNISRKMEAQLAQRVLDEDLREVDYLELYRSAWVEAGWPISPSFAFEALSREQECWDDAVFLAAGIKEALGYLRQAGLKTGIVSNAPFPKVFIERQIRKIGLSELMDIVVLSSEVGWKKPSPIIFHEALRQLNVQPEQCLFVGDRYREDYKGAVDIGMHAVIAQFLVQIDPPVEAPIMKTAKELVDYVLMLKANGKQ